jgi:hypothetical protein
MRSFLLAGFIFCLFGCTNESNISDGFKNLSTVTPKETLRFDTAGDQPFSHLGYSSLELDDGAILLHDREMAHFIKVDQQGNLIETIGKYGRGPQEYQDITGVFKSAFDKILVHDQLNNKIVTLSTNGEYLSEKVVPSHLGTGAYNAIYEFSDDRLLFRITSYAYMYDEDAEQFSELILTSTESESSIKKMRIRNAPYARRTGGGGGTKVPFAPTDLIAYDTESARTYLFATDRNTLTELNNSLDTVKVVSFNIEREEITPTERDSIKKENEEYWPALDDLLPQLKASSDRFLIDEGQNFWFKLNRNSAYEEWLVAKGDGKLNQIVQLPKGTMLTHISTQHLGVRVDDVTFALYENPISYSNDS